MLAAQRLDLRHQRHHHALEGVELGLQAHHRNGPHTCGAAGARPARRAGWWGGRWRWLTVVRARGIEPTLGQPPRLGGAGRRGLNRAALRGGGGVTVGCG